MTPSRPLAAQLLSDEPSHAAAAAHDGCLVLETNFRLYAYTSSPLLAKVLGQFVQILYRLPNLLACQLTRESIQLAVDRGLPIKRVVAFLERNVHPMLRAQV